jgi:ferredoxin
MNASELAVRIKSLAGASTADLVGIAPASAFSDEEMGDLGRSLGPIRSLVVLALHIVDPIQTVRFYSAPAYGDSAIALSFGDAMLRDACWRAVGILRDAGYRAAVARNLRYGASDARHGISYKKAAVLAGFGAAGRSNLLLHPEWGSWLYLRVVVTDAALEAGEQLAFSPCDGCDLCVAACPAGALSGGRFDRARCEGFYRQVGASPRGARALSPHSPVNCEECMRACPVGAAPPRLAGWR